MGKRERERERERERAGCFALTVSLMSCDSQCSVAFLSVLWVGLWCENVVLSDHIHLLFSQYPVNMSSTFDP